MNANLIPFAVTYQPRPFTLSSAQERDLLAYARSKGMTSHYVIRHLEPGVRNLITLRRTVLTYEQARARIDQLYEERTMPVRNIQISSNDMRGSTALSLLESAYPDEFASCETIHDVCKALEAHGYTYDAALNLWQQSEAGEEIVPDSALAAMDATDTQIDLYDALPIRQQEFLIALQEGKPLSKNAATRLALRRYGYITETDDWDAIELTEIGRAVVSAGIAAAQDDSEDVPGDPAPVQGDSDEDDADSHALTVGAKVIFTGDYIELPNDEFGIFKGVEGQITDLLPDGGAMVAFNGRRGDVSVSLTDIQHYDAYQRELYNAQKDRLARTGDEVNYKGDKGTVVKLRAGGMVLLMLDGGETPIWVRRGEFQITRFAADQSREQLEVLVKQVGDMLTISTSLEQQVEQLRAETTLLQADKLRLQQRLEDAERRANKPASLPPVGEMDSLREENARLRAELDAAKAPAQDEPEIPAGDLFSELRTLEGVRAQERARARLAGQVKKEFKILTRATVGQLENLINDGWEKFDSAFTSDADGVIDYSIVLARDIAQPASNGTHKAEAVTDERVSYIMPDTAPANGHIEAAELSFSDALRLRREGTLTTADVMQVGDLEAQQSARQAAEDLRAAQADDRPMRHISQVMVLPTIIAEVES